MTKENFFIERHSFKPRAGEKESEKHKGLSEKGAEAAEKQILGAKEMIEKSPQDAIVFLGGASEMERTKSTAEARGEGLKKEYKDNEAVLVLTKKEIQEIFDKQASMSEGLEELARIIRENKEKKIVLDYPLFVKQLSFAKHWGFRTRERREKKDRRSKYLDYLTDKYQGDEDKSFGEWISTKGKTDQDGLRGPDPEDVAEEYLTGIRRLKEIVEKYLEKNRPIVVGAITHRWDLDAFIMKMVRDKVDPKVFEEIFENKMTDENEGVYIEIEDDVMEIAFRGKKYSINLKELKNGA